MKKWFAGPDSAEQAENELIDHFVSIIEPRLKQVRGYREKLRRPIQMCQAHCRAVVSEIPGPILVKRSGTTDDSLIRAVFLAENNLQSLVKRVDAEYNGSLEGSRRFGLLTMRSTEKTVFGRKKQGDVILGDMAMRAITFIDHNIVGLSNSLPNSMKALESFCLDIMAESASRELSEKRTNLVDLRDRKEKLRAMSRMFGKGQVDGMGAIVVPFDPEYKEKKRRLQEMIIETDHEIVNAIKKSQTPEDWLLIMADFLSRPKDILSMHVVSLRLDWSNILTSDPDEKANTISLAAFSLSHEMQREGVLIAYDRDESARDC